MTRVTFFISFNYFPFVHITKNIYFIFVPSLVNDALFNKKILCNLINTLIIEHK